MEKLIGILFLILTGIILVPAAALIWLIALDEYKEFKNIGKINYEYNTTRILKINYLRSTIIRS